MICIRRILEKIHWLTFFLQLNLLLVFERLTLTTKSKQCRCKIYEFTTWKTNAYDPHKMSKSSFGLLSDLLCWRDEFVGWFTSTCQLLTRRLKCSKGRVAQMMVCSWVTSYVGFQFAPGLQTNLHINANVQFWLPMLSKKLIMYCDNFIKFCCS